LIKIIFIFLFLTPSLLAEIIDTNDHKPRYGLEVGTGMVYHSADFSGLPNVETTNPNYSSVLSSGIYWGLNYYHPWDDVWTITGGLSYSYNNAKFRYQEDQPYITLDLNSAQARFEYELDTWFETLNLNAGAQYLIYKKLSLHSGINIGINTSARYYQIEKITNSESAIVFKGEGISWKNNFSGEIEDVNSLSMGLNFGASYRFYLNKSQSLFLVPKFNYKFNFTPVVSDVSWNYHFISLGIEVEYRVPPPPPPPPLPPKNPPYPKMFPARVVPKLSASLKISKEDAGGKESEFYNLKVEDFVSVNMRPLLNYIFFDSMSYKIPDRYIKLNSRTSARFDERILQKKDAMETYYQVLNIYGKSLRANPNTNVTLMGCNMDFGEEENNYKISRKRAEAVRDYLVDVWEIEPERIDVRFRNLPKSASRSDTITGREENRRVEIRTSHDIAGSVLTVDTLRVFQKTKFSIYPKAESDAGVKLWKITLRQSKKILKEYSGEGDLPFRLYWLIDSNSKNKPQIGEKIICRLNVTDSVGQEFTTPVKYIPVDRLTVERKRYENAKDMEYEYYSLILFKYGKSDLGDEHKKVIDFVKERIGKKSRVKIYGYSDSVGDKAINKRISNQRALAVAKRLSVPAIVVEGVGESSLLYDNSLPEGRLYCRTVRIEIETPVGK
jgi:outer membrane protein OmpA-like peptidoglycan-associated protein